MPAFPCACCGYVTLSEGGHATHEICSICYWEDDFVQFTDPELAGGANRPSLRQAQACFDRIGACEEQALQHVRRPTPSDRRAPGRQPPLHGTR
jgi:Cysteine-rich CPCC